MQTKIRYLCKFFSCRKTSNRWMATLRMECWFLQSILKNLIFFNNLFNFGLHIISARPCLASSLMHANLMLRVDFDMGKIKYCSKSVFQLLVWRNFKFRNFCFPYETLVIELNAFSSKVSLSLFFQV